MKLIYSKYPKLANLTVALPFGSSRENIVTNGATHFLEHLIFKNRDKLSKEAEINAIEWNAWTTKDGLYMNGITIPENKEIMINEAKEFLNFSKIDQKIIDNEKRNILHENEVTSNVPSHAMVDFISASCYSGGVSMPIIGSRHNIHNMNTDIIGEFEKLLSGSEIHIFSNFDSHLLDGLMMSSASEARQKVQESYYVPQAEQAFYKTPDYTLNHSHLCISLHGTSWGDSLLGQKLLLNQIIAYNLAKESDVLHVTPISSLLTSNASFLGSMISGDRNDIQKVIDKKIDNYVAIDQADLEHLKAAIIEALEDDNLDYFDQIEYIVHSSINGFDKPLLLESIRSATLEDITKLYDSMKNDHRLSVHCLHEVKDEPNRKANYRFDIAAGRVTTHNKV